MWNFSVYEKEIKKFVQRDFSVITAAAAAAAAGQKSSC